MKKILFFTLVIGLMLCAAPTLAAELYVDSSKGSDDAGDGSKDSPYQTLEWAVLKMSSGDTLYIAGTHSLTSVIDIGAGLSGSEDAYTTLSAWPGLEATITSTLQPIQIGSGADYVKIADLNITTTNNPDDVSCVVVEGDYALITGNTVYGCGQSGIETKKDTTGTDVMQNEVYNTGSDDDSSAIVVRNDDAEVSYNLVHDNYSGIGMGRGTKMLVTNNMDYNNESRSMVIKKNATNITIANNTMYETTDGVDNFVLDSSFTGDDLTFQNNIYYVTGATSVASYMAATASTYISDNNLIYVPNNPNGIAENLVGFITQEQWQTAGNDLVSVFEDPLFSSTTSGSEDLHLTDTSPAINVGTTIDGLTDDYDAETRAYGAGYDIGADEHPVLPVPTGLASDPAKNSTTLSWLMGNYEVSGYTVNFGEELDLTDGEEKAADENAVLEVEELKAAKKYYAQVKAYFTTDYATYTSAYTDILSLATKPAKVKKFKVLNKATTTKSIKLRWKKYKRVKNYVVKVMNSKGSQIKLVKVKKTSTFVKNANKKYVKKVIKGLKAGKKYKFKVRARVKANSEWVKGKWSAIKTKKTLKN